MLHNIIPAKHQYVSNGHLELMLALAQSTIVLSLMPGARSPKLRKSFAEPRSFFYFSAHLKVSVKLMTECYLHLVSWSNSRVGRDFFKVAFSISVERPPLSCSEMFN